MNSAVSVFGVFVGVVLFWLLGPVVALLAIGMFVIAYTGVRIALERGPW